MPAFARKCGVCDGNRPDKSLSEKKNVVIPLSPPWRE